MTVEEWEARRDLKDHPAPLLEEDGQSAPTPELPAWPLQAQRAELPSRRSGVET